MVFGEASYWMEKAEEALYKKTGKKMFHGTLNVELKRDYIFEGNIDIMHKEEYGGTQEIYIKKCKVLGHDSYILRTDKNMSKGGSHPLNLLEIISEINFRKKYNLKDGDKVEIILK